MNMFMSAVILSSVLGLSVSSKAADFSPKFRWPDSGAIGVKEKVIKNGNVAVMAYKIQWQTSNGTKTFSYSDFRFISLNGLTKFGQDIEKIERAAAKALPVFTVDKDGHFLEMKNMDQAIAATASLGKNKGEIVKLFSRPEVRRALGAKLSEIWFDLSEAWGFITVKGDKATFQQVAGFALFDAYAPSGLKASYQGSCDYSESCARLTLELELQDKTAELIKSALAGTKLPLLQAPMSDMKIKKEMQANIDSNTLRPYDVIVKKTTTVKVDGRSVSSDEQHTYVFSWQE